jgi:hypothetical protein
MRKLIAVAVVAASWTVMSLGVSAPGTPGPTTPATISVSEGVVGTTVTVTGTECGLLGTSLRASNGSTVYVVGSGQLVVTVAAWPEPFASGFLGGTNDVNGVATATFAVPDVAAGQYSLTVECRDTTPCLRSSTADTGCVTIGIGAESAPSAIGVYPTTVPFTVLAPAAPTVPVVVAPSTTTG